VIGSPACLLTSLPPPVAYGAVGTGRTSMSPRSRARTGPSRRPWRIPALVGPFAGLAVPLLPAQILWINMLTHGLPGVALGAEPADRDARACRRTTPAAATKPSRPEFGEAPADRSERDG
jgi:hypothetical protein